MLWSDSLQSSSLKVVQAVEATKSSARVLLTPPTISLLTAIANDASDISLIIYFPKILLQPFSSLGFCRIFQSLSMFGPLSGLAWYLWNSFGVLYLARPTGEDRDKDKSDAQTNMSIQHINLETNMSIQHINLETKPRQPIPALYPYGSMTDATLRNQGIPNLLYYIF